MKEIIARCGLPGYAADIVLLFFIFAFAGWCMEVALKYRQFGRFINRGFLIGPYLPIYGVGVVLITLAGELLPETDRTPLTVFTASFFLCGAVEYFASWSLERRFHARWWDYSRKPMNLNGRVWIGNLMLFGVAGVVIIRFADPLIFGALEKVPLIAREIAAGVLLVVIAVDCVISKFVMRMVKEGVESSEADNTEEISREIRALLSDRGYFHRRFVEAYPEVTYRTGRVLERMEAVKREAERLRREAEQRVDAMKEKAGDMKEAVVEKAGDMKEAVVEKAGDMKHAVAGKAGDMKEAVVEKAGDMKEAVVRKAGDMKHAVVGKTGGAKDAVTGLDGTADDDDGSGTEAVSDLLTRQEALIRLLYNEETASDEVRAMVRELRERKKRGR